MMFSLNTVDCLNVHLKFFMLVLSQLYALDFRVGSLLPLPYLFGALDGLADHSGGCHHTPPSLTTSSPHLSVAHVKCVRNIFRITSSFVSTPSLH